LIEKVTHHHVPKIIHTGSEAGEISIEGSMPTLYPWRTLRPAGSSKVGLLPPGIWEIGQEVAIQKKRNPDGNLAAGQVGIEEAAAIREGDESLLVVDGRAWVSN
jgi:hypothetical protein